MNPYRKIRAGIAKTPDEETTSDSSSTQPDIQLKDLVDVKKIQAIIDDFHELTGIAMAMIDLQGRVLVGTGWQKLCTEFHRQHPETEKSCIESDTELTKGVTPGSFKLYKCKNGLWEVSTPLMVNNTHVGNLFIGQFFFEDEEIDCELFRSQAEKYGFDRKEYMKALEEVPVLSRKKVKTVMSFYTKLAALISQLGYTNLKLKHMTFHDELTNLYSRRYLEEELKKRDTKNQLPISIIICDINGLKLINDAYGSKTGDKFLKETAAILEKCCIRSNSERGKRMVARWGGDDFVVFLPQTSRQQAAILCSRITNECRDVQLEDSIPLSVSLGSATKTDLNIDNYQLLNKAEDNMHKHKLSESKSARSAVLSALLRTLGQKSYETEEHALRLRKMALKVGKKLGLPQSELDRLTVLVALHDIGKITISKEILTKPQKLNDEELKEIRKHPETGSRIAGLTEEFSHVAKDILSHHERWDGNGYPSGLTGADIPVLSRIAAVVDAYDVMTSGRSYRKSLSKEKALEQIKNNAGSQFDPEVTEAFVELVQAGEIK